MKAVRWSEAVRDTQRYSAEGCSLRIKQILDCSLLVVATRISVGGYEIFGETYYIHLDVVICYLHIQGSSAKKAMQCPAKEFQNLSCHNRKNVKSASFVFHREGLNVIILQI